MTVLARLTCVSEGYVGAPGMNILHFSGGTLGDNWSQEGVDGLYAEVNDVYHAFAAYMTSDATFTVSPTIELFESTTGYLVDVLTATTPHAGIVGTGATATLSRGTCFCVAYLTDVFQEGKRLKGRSFMGPIVANQFTSGGQIHATPIAAIPDFYTALTSGVGPRLAVYHRPSSHGATDGYYGDVTAVVLRSRPSHLRTRVR